MHADQFSKLASLTEFLDYEIKVFVSKPHLEQLLHLNEYASQGPLCFYMDRSDHM